MVIRQGDVFRIELHERSSSAPGFRHPHVVVQNDLFNRSQIRTVLMCALTTNLRRARAPGNVLLQEGEGNLPRRSVVNVTQLVTVDREDLEDRIGTLPAERVDQIVSGLKLLFERQDPF